MVFGHDSVSPTCVTTSTPRRCRLRTAYALAFSWDVGIIGRRGTLVTLWRLALARWWLGALLPGCLSMGRSRLGLLCAYPWIAPAFASSGQHRTRSRVVAPFVLRIASPEEFYTPTPRSPFPLQADQTARTTPAVFPPVLPCRLVVLRHGPGNSDFVDAHVMYGERFRRHDLPSTVSMVDDVGADSWEPDTCSPEGPMPPMFGLYSLGPLVS